MGLPTEFIDSFGDTVFVDSGLSGDRFMSFRRNPKSGGTHRVVTKYLPSRETREQALDDLRRYAAEKRWNPVTE